MFPRVKTVPNDWEVTEPTGEVVGKVKRTFWALFSTPPSHHYDPDTEQWYAMPEISYFIPTPRLTMH